MGTERQRAIDALVLFARLVSDEAKPDRILPFLADALVEHTHADAAAIVTIDAAGKARIVAQRGLPDETSNLALDADAIGEELGEQLRRASGAFGSEQTRPIVASGNLFGAVVMLYRAAEPITGESLRLAEGLVDLAALALGTAAQVERLEQSYAELRATQDVLAKTEKLRALGQMAAGVSHDLKNILNPLSLHLQFSERALARGNVDDAKTSIAEMRQVVVRGVETLERLRSYSRQAKETKTELVELDKLVHEAAQIAKPRMASSASGRVLKIVEDLHTPPSVMAMSGEIVSALVNLVVNAIDASAPTGGTITLRTGEADGGSFVEIADDGPGMPPDVQKRVFEPFFTTKGAEGTGLGLAMVYATVQRHGGTITLETAPGKGTCFHVWLPGPGPASVR
ncbi:MAG TPA: HAMP domain-containing sensor histidine kinase [Labilithrix sp.]